MEKKFYRKPSPQESEPRSDAPTAQWWGSTSWYQITVWVVPTRTRTAFHYSSSSHYFSLSAWLAIWHPYPTPVSSFSHHLAACWFMSLPSVRHKLLCDALSYTNSASSLHSTVWHGLSGARLSSIATWSWSSRSTSPYLNAPLRRVSIVPGTSLNSVSENAHMLKRRREYLLSQRNFLLDCSVVTAACCTL